MHKNKPAYILTDLALHLVLAQVLSAVLVGLSFMCVTAMGYAFFIGVLASTFMVGICFYSLTTYHDLVYTAINFIVNGTLTGFVFHYLASHPLTHYDNVHEMVVVLFLTAACAAVFKLLLDRLMELAGATRQNGNPLSKMLHLKL